MEILTVFFVRGPGMYGSVDLCYFSLISLCLEGSTFKLYIILVIEVRLCLACSGLMGL
jgi:hypothetical protein